MIISIIIVSLSPFSWFSYHHCRYHLVTFVLILILLIIIITLILIIPSSTFIIIFDWWSSLAEAAVALVASLCSLQETKIDYPRACSKPCTIPHQRIGIFAIWTLYLNNKPSHKCCGNHWEHVGQQAASSSSWTGALDLGPCQELNDSNSSTAGFDSSWNWHTKQVQQYHNRSNKKRWCTEMGSLKGYLFEHIWLVSKTTSTSSTVEALKVVKSKRWNRISHGHTVAFFTSLSASLGELELGAKLADFPIFTNWIGKCPSKRCWTKQPSKRFHVWCQGTAIPSDVFIFPMKESGAVPSSTWRSLSSGRVRVPGCQGQLGQLQGPSLTTMKTISFSSLGSK